VTGNIDENYYDQAGDVYGQTQAKVLRETDLQLTPLGDLALAALAAKQGEQILDIGCGAAYTCLQLAEQVGPLGKVLGVEQTSVLAELATARTRHIPQIQIAHSDAQTYAFEQGAYDALYSRFGVMAFSDPVSTFSHFKSALRPDGRLAFVCWRSFQENELDFLPFNAAHAYLPDHLVQDAPSSTPFSFSQRDTVETVLARAGFKDVALAAHTLAVSAGDVERTLELCLSVGALGRIIRKAPELRNQVAAPVRNALASKNSQGKVFMNAATWVVTARA